MVLKKFLPHSLFGRALLILVLPTILIQIVMAYVFFDRHWQNVTRYMSNALAGETAYLVMQLRDMPESKKIEFINNFKKATGLSVSLIETADYFAVSDLKKNNEFPTYQDLLASKIDEEFIIRRPQGSDDIEVRVKLANKVLKIQTTAKRLESPTTNIYLLWMVCSSILLLLIAVAFLRNQLRPIIRLAKAADNFGRGVDTPNFRPHGATEVRMAARAFITMSERIKRQLRMRTDMLSGISHDLRTPLARMKLELAMLPDSEIKKDLEEDVLQMEHMIMEYLDFARGEGGEESVETEIYSLISDVVTDYARINNPVKLISSEHVVMIIKPVAIRRMLHNLIDNALRYGKTAIISYKLSSKLLYIFIDDEGKGIEASMREEVFRPFVRLDVSRNNKTGGVGLGLSIARDIVLAHGGNIELSENSVGGLRVAVSLPFDKNANSNLVKL